MASVRKAAGYDWQKALAGQLVRIKVADQPPPPDNGSLRQQAFALVAALADTDKAPLMIDALLGLYHGPSPKK